MKCENSNEIIHKDVVIIGNGPSGLALSYMLSGHIPYLVSDAHPDEFLSARLAVIKNLSIIHQELGHLATGLEGRSTNPISLLLDALTHPCADIGFEMDPLVEWRKDGIEIDHVVLGKDPPGGSWHTMDPQILTLSLGSWMALPGLPYQERNGSEKRASAKYIAQYYMQYCKNLGLEKYFHNGVIVSEVSMMNDHCIAKACKEENSDLKTKLDAGDASKSRQNLCSLSNALSFIRLRGSKNCKLGRCCKRRKVDSEQTSLMEERKLDEKSTSAEQMPLTTIPETQTAAIYNRKKNGKTRSVSFSFCDHHSFNDWNSSCDNLYSTSLQDYSNFNNSLRYSLSVDFKDANISSNLNGSDSEADSLRLKVGCDSCSHLQSHKPASKWIVNAFDRNTGKHFTYVCKYVVLANGANNLPNKLTTLNVTKDPSWLTYDLPSFEDKLDRYLALNGHGADPVLVVGAGLSAADAIIATRCRNVPVLHVFRNKSANLGKQLPENMYPEYHKVHQMMQDGGSSYPCYTALPEFELVHLNESDKTVTLKSKTGKEVVYNVSFIVVLIGSRPDLSFLPSNFNLGVKKHLPIDPRTNTIDIDKLTHAVRGFEGLYAMGPLAGDNFVRFIPGGALAIVSDLYRKYEYSSTGL